MTRTYTLKKRAEQQEETRRRIVEAALELHSTIGPAHTTFSTIAERAGVQRHTLYAHFPEERSLFIACSGLADERDPLPDAKPWRNIADRNDRLRLGLAMLYDWYERNAQMTACVLRDAEYHAMTRETVERWAGPPMAAYADVLGDALNDGQRAVLQLALNFYTWRTLVRDAGLSPDAAVNVMICAINCAK
jgi:AcrR family transcriptional regulator